MTEEFEATPKVTFEVALEQTVEKHGKVLQELAAYETCPHCKDGLECSNCPSLCYQSQIGSAFHDQVGESLRKIVAMDRIQMTDYVRFLYAIKEAHKTYATAWAEHEAIQEDLRRRKVCVDTIRKPAADYGLPDFREFEACSNYPDCSDECKKNHEKKKVEE